MGNKDASNTVDEVDEIPEPKASRGDKKTRKLVANLGLTPIDPVRRVVMKQGERLIAFDSPDVYKLGNTFVVFGDAKVEDLNSAKRQAQMASQFKAPTPQPPQGETETSTDNQEDDDGEFNAKDIQMCMTQGNCSKAKAIEVLRKNDGDVVNSIMELTV